MGAPELLQHLRSAGLVLALTPAGGLHVGPRSAITDDHRAAIRANRDALVMALLGSGDTPTPALGPAAERHCSSCAHLTRRQTCGAPVAAGLAESWGIRWPQHDRAATCSAHSPAPHQPVLSDRPFRLTAAGQQRAHAAPWGDTEIERFAARASRLLALGFGGADAEDIAEGLQLRDVDGDDRRACAECAGLAGHRSIGFRCRRTVDGVRIGPLPTQLVAEPHRCPGFKPAEVRA